jgi:hypothetical protein
MHHLFTCSPLPVFGLIIARHDHNCVAAVGMAQLSALRDKHLSPNCDQGLPHAAHLEYKGVPLQGCLHPTHQHHLDIARQGHAADDSGKQLDRRMRHQFRGKLDRRQIIVQKRTMATMERVTTATDTGSALLPMTNPAEVLPVPIRNEHIRTVIVTLRTAFQPPGGARNRSKVSLVCHGNQQINVFWIRLLGG